MLSESQSASRKQEWAEANALAELSTEAVAKALAVVTETKLSERNPPPVSSGLWPERPNFLGLNALNVMDSL